MARAGRTATARGEETERLTARVRALAEAVELCAGRVPDDQLAEARRVIGQVDRRMALSGAATVVALAGATGSGKSSLFNALTGTDLARVGVRRPTTAHPLAGAWGTDSAEDLLDWLQIPRRHAVDPGSAEEGRLDGLVLLDLPDHDSTETSHRAEVDRLVQLVDLLVWVVDPQKYADAALHDGYLVPLARHAEVMMVVLNQADLLTPEQREQCLRDLRRLLASEGLGEVSVLAVSARTGEGVEELRRVLARQVAEKRAAARRLAADVSNATQALSEASGTAEAPGLGRASINQLNAALAEAAGAPLVAEAVGKAWRLRGGLATGWPVLSWLGRLRPDPLRRLHLDRLTAGAGQRKEIDPTAVGRSSLPATSGVQQARVDSALRVLVDRSSEGLTRGWSDAVRVAARSHHAELSDALDRAVAATDLDLERHRRWWQLVRVLQWLLVGAVVVGLLWLGSAFVLAYLQLPPLPEVTWWQLPAPTVLTLGGVLGGLLLAGLSRIGVEIGARRRERQARAALRAAIARVSAGAVVQPVTAELDRYRAATEALARARSAGR